MSNDRLDVNELTILPVTVRFVSQALTDTGEMTKLEGEKS